MKFKKYSNTRRLNEEIKAKLPSDIEKKIKQFKVKVNEFKVVEFKSGEVMVNIDLDFGNDVRIYFNDDLKNRDQKINFELSSPSGRSSTWDTEDNYDKIFAYLDNMKEKMQSLKNAAEVFIRLGMCETEEFLD